MFGKAVVDQGGWVKLKASAHTCSGHVNTSRDRLLRAQGHGNSTRQVVQPSWIVRFSRVRATLKPRLAPLGGARKGGVSTVSRNVA